MRPRNRVKLEIVGLMPTFFSHCEHCMFLMRQCELPTISSQLEEYPKELADLYFKISQLTWNVRQDFGGEVSIEVIDTASALGLWKSVKYKLKRTPAFVVNGRKVFEKVPSYDELKRELIKAGASVPGSKIH
ncbi:MAG: hypothetical protein ACE5OW_01850 [Candidatus Bathyarchaeia archaeon]